MNYEGLATGREISRLANIIRREMGNYSGNCEYSGAESRVLHFLLTNADNDIFQKDLEDVFGLRPATASQLMKRMEEHGLILRKPLESDQRRKEIIPTERAMEYRDKMIHDLNELEEKLVRGIDSEELNVFNCVIEKMFQNLS